MNETIKEMLERLVAPFNDRAYDRNIYKFYDNYIINAIINPRNITDLPGSMYRGCSDIVIDLENNFFKFKGYNKSYSTNKKTNNICYIFPLSMLINEISILYANRIDWETNHKSKIIKNTSFAFRTGVGIVTEIPSTSTITRTIRFI